MTVFKIGDKARIREDLKDGIFYDTCIANEGCKCYCNFAMTQYAGTAVVVAGKNSDNGYMDLRTIGDGASITLPWNWSDDMLEPIEEESEPHGFLDVCAVVNIRSDIAKRVDKKNRIWITLDGKKCPSIPVSNEIKESGNKAVVITEVLSRPGHMDGCAYRARFAGSPDNPNIAGVFDITMFNCLEDWLAAEKGNKHSDDKSKKGFKVGDKVVIKATVSSGKCVDGVNILRQMFDQAYDKSNPSHPRRKIGTVTYVYKDGALEIGFERSCMRFTWPQSAFELYDGSNGKPRPSKKKKNSASTADYSGYTPKSEFSFYDYLNRPVTCEKNAMENITKIEVTVMSGDETGCFYGVYNGKPWQYKFDAAESRFQSYDDGSYTVEGRENIEKWINWSYDPEKAIYAEYSMERMRAFKR